MVVAEININLSIIGLTDEGGRQGVKGGGEKGGGALARVRRKNANCTLQGEITGCTELLGNITLVTRTLSLVEL